MDPAEASPSSWPSHAPAGHGAPTAAPAATIHDLIFGTSSAAEVDGSSDAMDFRSLYGFEKPSAIQQRGIVPFVTDAGPVLPRPHCRQDRLDHRDLPLHLPDRPRVPGRTSQRNQPRKQGDLSASRGRKST